MRKRINVPRRSRRRGFGGKLARRVVFDFTYADKGFSVEAAEAKGRKLPQWFLDEPPTGPTDEFYVRAFHDLDTERPSSYGGLARLPWSKIKEYAEYHGLDPANMDAFIQIMRAMDDAYRDWQEKNKDRARANDADDKT